MIEPDDMKAEAARGGFEWQWTRKPTIVAPPSRRHLTSRLAAKTAGLGCRPRFVVLRWGLP